LIQNLSPSWQSILADEFQKAYFRNLVTFVQSQRKQFPGIIYPAENQTFQALNLCEIENIKVVILGQDPYPTKGHANGLSFSVQPTVFPLPKSLQNIFKELKANYPEKYILNGDLTSWSKQGVLLLNTTLTVQEGIPNSHSKQGWEIFTDEIILKISQNRNQVVFLLFGKDAHSKETLIDANKHLLIKTSHPSPLGVFKSGKDFVAFQGSNIFTLTNSYLKSHEKAEINW
jgi:uracil-DNA glycosylase